MDYISLLNSKSIEKYWREIGYQPNSLEAAWIVYSNRKLNFSEKCKYWEEIINTMPDMEIPERVNCNHYDSLHKFLLGFINISRRFIDWFYYYPGSMYTLTIADDDYYQFDAVFSSMDTLKGFIKSEECEDVYSFIVNKIEVDDYDRNTASIKLNKDLRSVCQADWDYGSFPCSEEEYELIAAFNGMQFRFPVPFKKGDLLIEVGYNKSECECKYTHNPVVFDSLCSDDEEDMRFTCWGLFQYFYIDCCYPFRNYMDFELYNGEIKGVDRILKLWGNYKKGLTRGETMMAAYNQIVSEERAKRDSHYHIPAEERELIGVKVNCGFAE